TEPAAGAIAGHDTSDLFERWCKEHTKTYSSEEEKRYRFRVFENNHSFVSQHNQSTNVNNSTYTLSLNAFADLTHHEFKTSRLGFSPSLLRFKRVQNQQPRHSYTFLLRSIGDRVAPLHPSKTNQAAILPISSLYALF
ncbi:hypothetical protein V8G54_028711, partial [Vigna mungo]